MGNIYVAGVLPAACFGSAVVGMSNYELQDARRVLLPCHPPRHRGCSLQARLAIFGDPVWRPSVAPALHWASIVWMALASPAISQYNIKELAQL